MVLRGQLWSADPAALTGDDRELPLEELKSQERHLYDQSRRACMCGVCDLLRPDGAALRRLLDDLRRGRSGAAWYLARTQAPSAEVLTLRQ
ncbi:hypothetical protein AB0H83_20820 [Dactylosporangium sp. NPDC050688]|uniref:hypothetical protein n=1 Tax=Dactylosporangium sp. NPDC050688 TaxID=3157217 RepID=UPI0033C37CF4